jgi:hypothetical protein
MPVEIRELVIKVTITEEEERQDQSKELQDLKNKVVKECIEKIMTKLETLQER